MSWIFGSNAKRTMVAPDDALPGHDQPLYTVPDKHAVLGTPLKGPFPEGAEVIYFAMGCFWGAEKKFWRLPGVVTTAAGYMGGYSPNPTYDEVCTARTGHTEAVMVVYFPDQISTYDLLKVFWENHDPTTLYAQGGDIGTQYRSAIYWTTEKQAALVDATREAYDAVLKDKGFDPITTEIEPAEGREFFYAEDYHQQYLYKVPHGYDCHAHTGIDLPAVTV